MHFIWFSIIAPLPYHINYLFVKLRISPASRPCPPHPDAMQLAAPGYEEKDGEVRISPVTAAFVEDACPRRYPSHGISSIHSPRKYDVISPAFIISKTPSSDAFFSLSVIKSALYVSPNSSIKIYILPPCLVRVAERRPLVLHSSPESGVSDAPRCLVSH